MYRLFLSARFLLHHWLMTLLGSFFVGASLVILIVVMAIMDGFQSRLKATYAGSSGDLWVTPLYPCDYEALESVVLEKVPLAVAGGPYFESITLLRREGKLDPTEQEFHFAVVRGVDGVKEGRINNWIQNLRRRTRGSKGKSTVVDPSDPFRVYDPLEAAAGTRSVILGKSLMEAAHVGIGQKVKLFSLSPKSDRENGAEENGAEKRRNEDLDSYELKQELFLVVGTFQTGNAELDEQCVYVDHRDFNAFFDDSTARRAVRFRLSKSDAFHEAKAVLQAHLAEVIQRSALPGAQIKHSVTVDSWLLKNRNIMAAIESEKSMILIIAFLIVVAGASSIFAAQWLLVSDKIREIGLLRALGASLEGVTTTFVMNGFLMGVLGSVGGTFGGLLVVEHIDTVHAFLSWITGREIFDKNIYLFDKIPTSVDYGQITQFALAALVCTLIASAIPALRAGLMDPSKALRRD